MYQDRVHDPDLLDVLEAMDKAPFDGHVWRVAWSSSDPLIGGVGGGRWHPANDFETLYTSTERDGALAEIYHHLSKAPVFSSREAKLYKLRVRAEQTLVFENVQSLAAVGIDEETFLRGGHSRAREVGTAARFLDLEGLVVPGARWNCSNLVLFPDRLSNTNLEALKVVEESDINWPAWRESTRNA